MLRNPSSKFFLRLFAPIAILLLAGVYFYGQAESARDLSRLKRQDVLNVALGTAALSQALHGITGDLYFLAGHSVLRAVVDEPTSQHLDQLAERFADFSRSKGVYDQVRWIDETGMERVRVDLVKGEAVVVPADRLQNKARRYYFTDSFRLKPGEVFVSPLDLNIEQGRIELPYKPMLRVATPVTDSRGAKRGIVILNYYGRVMLDAFAQATAGIADHAMLVNGDGYWLKGQKQGDEWGFMFERTDLSLAAQVPAAWARIRAANNGQEVLADGLWTWGSVYPVLSGETSSTGAVEAFAPSRGELTAKHYVWKSVAHVPAGTLSALRRAIWLKLAAVTALLLGLLGFGAWRLARSEEDVRRLNAGLERQVDERTRQLSDEVAARDREIAERRRAESALKSSEEKFKKAFHVNPDAIAINRIEDGLCVSINRSYTRIMGYTEGEIIGHSSLEFNIWVDPEDRARMVQGLKKDGVVANLEARFRTRDGGIRIGLMSATAIDIDNVPHVLNITRDITERKAADAKIQWLTRMYAALSQCNQAIVHCASEEELFPEICRVAVEFGGMKMAWIGLLGPGTRMVRIAARYGDDADGYLQGIEISADADSPYGRGPAGIAVRENRPTWHQDFLSEPHSAPWHERRARFGFRASASLPLHRNGIPTGVLTLYAGEVGAFDEAARKLLTEMAADIDFALDNFAREAARERAQQELRAAEEQFRGLVEQSIAGIYIIQDGKFAYVNPRLAEIRGFGSADEMIGRDSTLLIAENDRDTVLENNRRLLAGEVRSINYGFTALRKDGSSVEVGVHSARATHKGRPAVIGLLQDVSEKKRADAALRASEEKFAKAFRSSPMLMAISTVAEGRYIDVNEGFLRATGRTREEVIDRASSDIALWKAPQDRQRALDSLLKNGRIAGFEAELCKKSGEPMRCEIWAEPIAIGGEPCVIWVVNDVTKRHEAEEARTRLEVQLLESQKMEALGTLAGGVAHDFNNIIAAIIGNAELAREDVGPGHAASESLEEIRKASVRAKALVQQILSFSRRQVLERSVISLAPVVEESARLLRATLPAGITLNAACERDAPRVLADETQIEQVLINLCNNASYALQNQTYRGCIAIRLSAYDHVPGKPQETHTMAGVGGLEAGRYACLSVSDNGPGMSEETLAHIFEPFFTTKPHGEGTGLGLSVVHGIVQGHEARIDVRSTPGEGTSFSIYFRAARSPGTSVRAPRADAPAANAGQISVAQGAGRHILYLDDDDAIVFLMVRLLERKGYRVSGYTDAREALQAVRANPGEFDLAVTDYNMPGMSGLDVASALREIRADLPVALASGYVDEELHENALAAGIVELIYKPGTADELCEVVARLASARNEN